jgi:hypothetical protein
MEVVKIKNTEYEIHPQDNGQLLLKPLCIYLTKNDINNLNIYDFSNSKIINCNINNQEHHKLKYRNILDEIYKIINNGTKIIKNTTINIQTLKINDRGFYYLKDIGISIQGIDSNKCIYEIINQCINNDIIIEINIELSNTRIINICIK